MAGARNASAAPYPGSCFQRWHRDGGGEVGAAIERTPGVGVKFPLCDTSEENGAFEVVPIPTAKPHACF